jgi:N-acyl-L-homoserine lactone synthetase
MQVHLVNGANRRHYLDEIEAMHRHRHRIFVDLMKWRALESPDRLDIDEFDNAHASYLILLDSHGEVRGSGRLIPSWRPNIFGSLFPEYAAEGPPVGPMIWEWSRHAPGDPRFSEEVNRQARLLLNIAVLEFAASRGIEAFTAILDTRMLDRTHAVGWRPRPLGMPRSYGEGSAVGVQLDVDPDHLTMLRERANRADPVLIEVPAALPEKQFRSARRSIELAMQLPESALAPAVQTLERLVAGEAA